MENADDLTRKLAGIGLAQYFDNTLNMMRDMESGKYDEYMCERADIMAGHVEVWKDAGFTVGYVSGRPGCVIDICDNIKMVVVVIETGIKTYLKKNNRKVSIKDADYAPHCYHANNTTSIISEIKRLRDFGNRLETMEAIDLFQR